MATDLTGPPHATSIEFDGFLYYWTCDHPHCRGEESYHHMYRHAAESEAADHESQSA